jgi:hypothetical protein
MGDRPSSTSIQNEYNFNVYIFRQETVMLYLFIAGKNTFTNTWGVSFLMWELAYIFCLPPAYLLLLAEILFDPEDGDDMFLRNVRCISTYYMVSHPRR